MLLALAGILAAAPIYWFVVPERARKNYLAIASLLALGIYDPRLPVLLVGFSTCLWGATRLTSRSNKSVGRMIMLAGFATFLALFLYNKLSSGDDSNTVIASQRGLVFLGISYFVLKAVAVLVDTFRGSLKNPGWLGLTRWLVFLPVYASGPIEAFKHFDDQSPGVDRGQIQKGLERILFGCVRAMVIAHYLGEWSSPILSAPENYPPVILFAAVYAFTLRFYFDFAGYSDIAIGLAAVYGYKIQENFDHPLFQRNLANLWQRWHMTLTTWMRLYLFTPLSRSVMRRGGPRFDTLAIIVAQIWAMMFCGFWHGFVPVYALWALCHATGLLWCNLVVRRIGGHLPSPWVAWWRKSPVAYAVSCWLSVTTFSLINVIVASDLPATLNFFAHLLALR